MRIPLGGRPGGPTDEAVDRVLVFGLVQGELMAAQVLAKELIALQPDVILANSTPVAAALQQETSKSPIVLVGVADPIGSGFVASFAKPGGNMTGPTLYMKASVTGKWRAMLKEIAPNLVRAAFLKTASSVPYFDYYMHAALALAPSLGIEPVTSLVEHESAADIERACHRVLRDRAERWLGRNA